VLVQSVVWLVLGRELTKHHAVWNKVYSVPDNGQPARHCRKSKGSFFTQKLPCHVHVVFLNQDQVGVARSEKGNARMVGDHGTRGVWWWPKRRLLCSPDQEKKPMHLWTVDLAAS